MREALILRDSRAVSICQRRVGTVASEKLIHPNMRRALIGHKMLKVLIKQ